MSLELNDDLLVEDIIIFTNKNRNHPNKKVLDEKLKSLRRLHYWFTYSLLPKDLFGDRDLIPSILNDNNNSVIIDLWNEAHSLLGDAPYINPEGLFTTCYNYNNDIAILVNLPDPVRIPEAFYASIINLSTKQED